MTEIEPFAPPRRRRGWLIVALAGLAALLMVAHRLIPNTIGNLGSLVETFLPWLGLAVPVLLVVALVRRSAFGAIAAALAAVVWLGSYGQLLIPGKGGGEHQLRVLTHNVGVSNADPAGTVRTLLEADADLVALQELSNDARSSYAEPLNKVYPHVVSRGTVALWSKFPFDGGASSVDIGIGWTRALRAQVNAPGGMVAVYVAHLASVRVDSDGFGSEQRDHTIVDLGEAIAAEKLSRVMLLGDLNGTAYDRSLAPLTYGLDSAQAQAGFGFGFSWPAKVPLARIDHILTRGMTATRAWVLPRTGSDHRPVAAELRL